MLAECVDIEKRRQEPIWEALNLVGAPSIKASGSIRFQFFTGRSRSEGVDIPAVSLWLSGHRRVFCYWWNDDPPPQPGGRSSSGPSGFNLWMARRMSASSCASTSASVNHRGPSCGPPRSRHSASHRSTSVLAFWSSCRSTLLFFRRVDQGIEERSLHQTQSSLAQS